MTQVSLCVVDREGETRALSAPAGQILMTVLRDEIDFTIGTCGGVISCGTCRVLLDSEWLARVPPAGAEEIEMLEAIGDEPGSRLACQLVLTEPLGGLRLTIAPAT